MSEPELEFEIDEFGCIRYRVINEGALLSKDEKEFIIDYVTRMQAENTKLREEFDKMDVWHSKELTAAMDDNAKLRELARDLHMAYVETLNECESLNEGLIWEYSGSIDDDVVKSKAKFEANRHRFDDALCELGVQEDE